MSATDDALTDSTSLTLPAPARSRPARLLLPALGALAGAALALAYGPRLLPPALPRFEASAEWRGAPPDPRALPRALRAGESVRRAGPDEAPRLIVAGPDREGVATLAEVLSRRRLSGADADADRRRSLREDLDFDRFIGPLFRLSPQAECVARLHAYARVIRALAGADPRPSLGEPPADAADALLVGAIANAAGAGDPGAVAEALEAASEVERERLSRRASALPRLDGAEFAEAWAARQHRLGDQLAAIAAPLDAALTPLQQELADLTSPSEARRIEPGIATPSAALLASPIATPAARVRANPWIPIGLGAAGAIAGLLVMLPIAPLAARKGPRVFRAKPGAGEPGLSLEAPTPGRESAWLQLVSGANPHAVALAVMEIAARGVAMGGRVLVIDAGRRLRLHRHFEVDSRLGFLDCLDRPMPVLGLVQRASIARLLLLAYGDASRAPVWTRLDRLLEEVRPHCDQVVLALDPAAPNEVGSVLAGRVMDGWWADYGSSPQRARLDLSDRIGIALFPLTLSPSDEPSVEVLRRRIVELEARHPAVLTADSAEPIAPPLEVKPLSVPAPDVLDSDLQVRERLRFMAWMRRVQADGRRAEPVNGSRH